MALFRIPRGCFVFSRKSPMALLLLRDIIGKALLDRRLSGSVLRWTALALRCYGFTKSLSQPDVKGECPAPLKLLGRPRESTLKSEEERERFKAVLVVLSGTSLDTRRRLSQSDCSCGAEPRPCLWGISF